MKTGLHFYARDEYFEALGRALVVLGRSAYLRAAEFEVEVKSPECSYKVLTNRNLPSLEDLSLVLLQ